MRPIPTPRWRACLTTASTCGIWMACGWRCPPCNARTTIKESRECKHEHRIGFFAGRAIAAVAGAGAGGAGVCLRAVGRRRHADGSLAEVEPVRLLSRLSPMLGLIATMIPLGPALQSVAAGNGQQALAVFSGAFAGVVLALAAASVGLVVYSVRRRWLLAELLVGRNELEAPECAGGGRRRPDAVRRQPGGRVSGAGGGPSDGRGRVEPDQRQRECDHHPQRGPA